MDNVTHTLIGIAAAELLPASQAKKARVPLWVASALANNLPDLDVILTWGKHSDRLDYLLHHRGHTHTYLLAPLQGALLLGLLWLFWRKREDTPWKDVAFLCLFGPILHVTADSWNTYGVHPFWPWNNRWFYGDLVFIIEPWLWVAFLPMIWKRAESLVGKALALVPLALIAAISWYHPFVQWQTALAITLGGAAWLYAQTKIQNDRLRLHTAGLLCAIVFGAFALGQANVRARFNGADVTVLNHPANPFCATIYTAGFEGDVYKAAIYTAAPFSALVPATACKALIEEEDISADLQPVEGPVPASAREVIPLGEFRSTKAEFDRVAATCRGRAFLRFARVPFWFKENGEDYLGDLRFDRDRTISFAEIPLGAERGCPRNEPPWIGRFFPPEDNQG
jgi:inner membrane protein